MSDAEVDISKNLFTGDVFDSDSEEEIQPASEQPKNKKRKTDNVVDAFEDTEDEDEAFIAYTATIPAAFLSMFHEPHKTPVGDAQVHIEYTHVPIWPVLGLKERLGQVLGRDVVGNFDETNLETFDDGELTPIPEAVSPKRRREVFSEVLNVSFTEDHEPGRENGMGKRRRLEEGRVGVVR